MTDTTNPPSATSATLRPLPAQKEASHKTFRETPAMRLASFTARQQVAEIIDAVDAALAHPNSTDYAAAIITYLNTGDRPTFIPHKHKDT